MTGEHRERLEWLANTENVSASVGIFTCTAIRAALAEIEGLRERVTELETILGLNIAARESVSGPGN